MSEIAYLLPHMGPDDSIEITANEVHVVVRRRGRRLSRRFTAEEVYDYAGGCVVTDAITDDMPKTIDRLINGGS